MLATKQLIKNAIHASLKHPRILAEVSRGRSAVNSRYCQLEVEKERKKYMEPWVSFFTANPDGLMSVQGFLIYVPRSTHLFSLLEGVYEPKTTSLFKSLIDKESIVVDVGANLGYFTLLAAKVARKVYAFEPEPENFQMLSKSVERNSFKNVELHSYCMLDTVGTTDLYLSDSALTHSTVIKEGHNKTITVKCVTLDSLFPTETIDLLKIDVEGAELKVLKGARKMISDKRVRNIIVEYNPGIWDGEIESVGTKGSKIIQENGWANMYIKLN